jgi:hypothetical protein
MTTKEGGDVRCPAVSVIRAVTADIPTATFFQT